MLKCDDGALGIAPLLVSHTLPGALKVPFYRVAGWAVAYPGEGKVRWGWASPELTDWSGPVWQDWYLQARPQDHDLDRLHYRKWTLGTTTEAASVSFLEGPYLMALLDNNQWQLHTMPNYVHPDATFDRPNTFGGQIAPAPTVQEAIAVGEKWMRDYLENTSAQLAAVSEDIQKDVAADYAERLKREAILKQQAAKKAAAAADLAAWKERQRIESEQRYTTEASYKGLEPSFTHTLRNISIMGATQRAIQSLKTQSRLLRERR